VEEEEEEEEAGFCNDGVIIGMLEKKKMKRDFSRVESCWATEFWGAWGCFLCRRFA
jgi:hypothetical protein